MELNGFAILEERAALAGTVRHLGRLSAAFAAASGAMTRATTAVNALAPVMRAYETARLRLVRLRHQAIAKARGRNWRTVRA